MTELMLTQVDITPVLTVVLVSAKFVELFYIFLYKAVYD